MRERERGRKSEDNLRASFVMLLWCLQEYHIGLDDEPCTPRLRGNLHINLRKIRYLCIRGDIYYICYCLVYKWMTWIQLVVIVTSIIVLALIANVLYMLALT